MYADIYIYNMYADIYIYIFCNVRFVSFDITFFALKKICEYTYTHTHTHTCNTFIELFNISYLDKGEVHFDW